MVVRICSSGDIPHLDRLANNASYLEFVVKLSGGSEFDNSWVGLAAVLPQGPSDGSPRRNDRGAASTIAEWEVRETRWKDSFAEDGLTGVENVVSGTGEIGKIANVYWHVQLRLCD